MSKMRPDLMKFGGLNFWAIAQKIKENKGIKPKSKDTLRALKVVGSLTPQERLAAFITLGSFYSELSAENKAHHGV